MDAMQIADGRTPRAPQIVTPIAFEDDRQIPQRSRCFAAAHPATGVTYAVTLLSHLKEIIFSTYKKDRSRITWTLYRVNVGRVLLLSHDKNAQRKTPLAAPGKQLANRMRCNTMP
ncbi:hypothetical protein [Rhizobium sp. CIAT894]|uniref:hypothetical protein n=1 Tax=Rhizobium sp. CIAT894 TaxID=2020312 RepID=UPI0003FCF733|nr:hypothetical protein [Rhizobium sp. CIAT894]